MTMMHSFARRCAADDVRTVVSELQRDFGPSRTVRGRRCGHRRWLREPSGSAARSLRRAGTVPGGEGPSPPFGGFLASRNGARARGQSGLRPTRRVALEKATSRSLEHLARCGRRCGGILTVCGAMLGESTHRTQSDERSTQSDNRAPGVDETHPGRPGERRPAVDGCVIQRAARRRTRRRRRFSPTARMSRKFRAARALSARSSLAPSKNCR